MYFFQIWTDTEERLDERFVGIEHASILGESKKIPNRKKISIGLVIQSKLKGAMVITIVRGV